MPYNNFLLAAVADSKAFELLVHFQRLKGHWHPWRAPLKAPFPWRSPGRPGWLDPEAIRLALSERESYFVLGGWGNPWMVSVALARIARRLPFAIWTDCPQPGRRSGLKGHLRSRWLAHLFAKADKILVTGRPGETSFRRMGCPAEKIVLFPYWVPLPELAAAPEPSGAGRADQGPVRFLALGRLEPLKRFDLALCAMERILREAGADSAELTVVGEGSERGRLERMAQVHGLRAHVRFLGWQEHPAAMRLLEGSDVLVHPADWEPYGVAVLEAMALAKPVIASDRTMAALDRVFDGTNGFLFKSGDAQALADCMRRFVADRTLIAQLGRRARLTAEEWPANRAVDILKQVASIA